MKTFPAPISHARLIENHIAVMRMRDKAAELYTLRLDINIMQCELAVDQAFARAGFSAPCEVQRP